MGFMLSSNYDEIQNIVRRYRNLQDKYYTKQIKPHFDSEGNHVHILYVKYALSISVLLAIISSKTVGR